MAAFLFSVRMLLPPLLVTISWAQPDSGQAWEKAEDVRFLSFNIRHGAAKDGANAWEHRRAAALKAIDSRKPDIAGFQEVLAFQLDELRERFTAYTFLGEGRNGGRRGEFSPLMILEERFEVTDSGTFWLSPTPDVVGSRGWDAALPRICTFAFLRDRTTDTRLAVYNAHFDHRGKRSRLEAARVIGMHMRTTAGERPCILLGDLNAGEDSEPLKLLKSLGLRDTFRVLHPSARRVGTFSGFRTLRTGAKIDYVLCDSSALVVGARIHTARIDGRDPSDHHPVSATLRFPKEGRPVVPVIEGPFEKLGTNPSLGKLHGRKQEIVDHGLVRATDGSWHLWACIRETAVGRILYRWQANHFERRPFEEAGIGMRARAEFGESIDDWGGKEWIQAPHFLWKDGICYMFYGGPPQRNRFVPDLPRHVT